VESVAEFTGWPITRIAREPAQFVAPHPGGLFVFGEVTPIDETERWIAADSRSARCISAAIAWSRCYSVQCLSGEEGHVTSARSFP